MEIITPEDYVGAVMELAQNRRGEFINMQYLTESRTTIVYDLPLAEVVSDFFDQLKSKTKGYASMEYTVGEFRCASHLSPSSAVACCGSRDFP